MTNPLAQDLGGVVLLPCPGCGGTATRVIGGPGTRGGPQYWAGCDHCRWRTWGDTEADAIAAWNTRTYSAEIAGALRDAERLDWMASGEQKMLQRSIDGQWFRVYLDVAAQDAEHAEWSAMTEAHFTTARAAIDSAMQQGGGGGDHG